MYKHKKSDNLDSHINNSLFESGYFKKILYHIGWTCHERTERSACFISEENN